MYGSGLENLLETVKVHIRFIFLRYSKQKYRGVQKGAGGLCKDWCRGDRRVRQWFSRLMNGRYGSDQFGRFLSILSLILLVVGLILQNSMGTMLTWLAIVCLIYIYFRMFSKNTNKRYEENVRYLNIKGRVKGFFSRKIRRLKQQKDYRFIKCPKCGVTVRVPRGKGKIKISCPKCYNTFIRKT